MRLGDLEVSPMGLGTWSWGNQLLWGYDEKMDPELQQVFNLAVSKGINLFDTADSYGTGRLNGKSEQLLGTCIREYPGSRARADGVLVATKFATYPWRVLPWNIVAAAKGSLRRLGAEQVAIGQLHWSASNYAPLQEIALVNGLSDCYDQGLIRAAGVSNYGPKELRKVHAKFAKRGVPLSSAQIQFSLLSWGPEQQEAQEVAGELGVGLISYSPLALGLLTGKYDEDNLPQGPRGALFKQLLPKIRPVLDVLREISVSRKKSMSQVAISWCMSKGTVPIPGAKDTSQALDNLGALGWKLSGGEVAALDGATRQLSKGMTSRCLAAEDAVTDAEAASAHMVIFSEDLFSEAVWPKLDRASKAALRGVCVAMRKLVDGSIKVVSSPASGASAGELARALVRWPRVKDLTLLGVRGGSSLQALSTATLPGLESLTVREAPRVAYESVPAWRMSELSSRVAAALRCIDVSGCSGLTSINAVRSCGQLRVEKKVT
ncbi:hypothetical protein FOA52_005385 [Chlamydomonas sp. UWO 241]|nr:hypothetical protein FOA52_005385 [Chlamydomonas sp. UWO 241]